MYTLIYNSEVITYLGNIDISSLLYAARKSNAKHKITGLLLHSDGNFIQVIEGEEATVKKLYEIIRNDRRHKNVQILMEKEISERQFEWNMGFKDISENELDEYPAIKSVAEGPALDSVDDLYNCLVAFNTDQECEEAFYE